MSLNISGFIKKLLPSLDKSELESDIEISLESISTIIEVYSNLEQVLNVADLANKENKEVVKEFYKELTNHKPTGVKLSPKKNIASDTLLLFKNAKINGDFLYKELSDALNDVIVSQALTAYKANILRSVGHFYFITKYSLDLANFIYTNEAEEGFKDKFNKEYKLNKKQKELIIKNVWIYSRLLSVYGSDPDAFKKNIENLSEINIPKEEVDTVIDSFNSDKVDLFNNLPSGFIGSPIYSIRLIFATWEADRYKELLDKKKLLELRYLHFKLLKENGKSDINMEKEIEYLQKRITDIDYKLSKIEEGLED